MATARFICRTGQAKLDRPGVLSYAGRVQAIMYHDVVEDGDFASSGFPGEGAHVYKLRRQDF